MAVKSVKTIVCDACGGDANTIERYVISAPDGRRTVDLHPKHVDELTLTQILRLVGPPKRGQKMRGQEVVTEAEIARARKQTARKRTAKKATAKRK